MQDNQDKAIGRPGVWQEGRYQKPGQKPDQSVLTPPGSSPTHDAPVSTPVTRKDYEFPRTESPADEVKPP